MRAKTRRQAQGVFKVVVPAFAKRNARQFGVGFFEVGNRRYEARVQAAYGDGVFQTGTHGVTGEPFGVADDDVADVFTKGVF